LKAIALGGARAGDEGEADEPKLARPPGSAEEISIVEAALAIPGCGAFDIEGIATVTWVRPRIFCGAGRAAAGYVVTHIGGEPWG